MKAFQMFLFAFTVAVTFTAVNVYADPAPATSCETVVNAPGAKTVAGQSNGAAVVTPAPVSTNVAQ